MSFSAKELHDLGYFRSIAVQLNTCEEIIRNNKDNEDELFYTKYGFFYFSFYFKIIKDIILYLDLSFKEKDKLTNIIVSSGHLPWLLTNFDNNIRGIINNYNKDKNYKDFSFEDLFDVTANFLIDIFKQNSSFKGIVNINELNFESINFLKSLLMISNNEEFSDEKSLQSFLDKINIIDKRVDDIYEKNIINSSNFQKELDNFFSLQRGNFEKKSNEVIIEFNQKIKELEKDCTTGLPELIDSLKGKVKASEGEVNNLDQAIESFKSTVSTKIQNEISKHYQKKAKMEMWTYWGATTFSIILILSSLGLLAWGLVDYYHDYISTNVCLKDEAFNACISRLEKVRDITKNIGITFFVMRFSFSLLLFLTVIYTSRIAIRAYSHWRHSENMHLKLSSLEPFITELPKEVRHEIHRELIPDYFGKDAGLVETTNEKFKDLPANVSAVAMKAIEQISGGGSNSSTEKNGKKSADESQ